MANELTLNFSLRYSNGNITDQVEPFQLQVNQTTQGVYSNTQIIGTSTETVTLGADIVAHGYCFIRNLDTTNFIEVGPDSSGIINFMKLLAGQFGVFPLHSSATVKAKADTAACKLFVKLFDL